MGLSAATMRKMLDLGLSFEEACELAEVWEEGEHLPVPAEAITRKRERDAARMRDKREQERQSRDVASDCRSLPETKGSPEPLPKTQPSQNPPKPPLRGSKGSRRCPESWSPKPATIAALEGEGFTAGDLERALTRMRDCEFRTAHSDWDATFRNWVRTDADRNPRRAHERSAEDPRFVARQANLARALAGADSAAGRRWEP